TGAAVIASIFAACALGFAFIATRDMFRQRDYGVALGAFGQHVLKLAAAGMLALAVFFVLNPAWWGADLSRLVPTILDWRQELLAGQAHDHNGYAEPLANAEGFARQVFLAQPQYFEARTWREIQPIADQIAAYEASPWPGIALGGSAAGAGVMLLLLGAGIFALLRDPELELAVRLPVGVWALTMALVAFISPVEWQRYYLPFYPAIGLLGAYGPFGIARWWRKIRAEREAKRAAQQTQETI
ncbi:MAG: hypothetical protein KC547_12915, partial [Anaerolineae bacterium]|nr:hypothetical protein [Anaerolineae bacterium]